MDRGGAMITLNRVFVAKIKFLEVAKAVTAANKGYFRLAI